MSFKKLVRQESCLQIVSATDVGGAPVNRELNAVSLLYAWMELKGLFIKVRSCEPFWNLPQYRGVVLVKCCEQRYESEFWFGRGP